MSTAVAVPAPGTVAVSPPAVAGAALSAPAGATLPGQVVLGFAVALVPVAALTVLALTQVSGLAAVLALAFGVSALAGLVLLAAWLLRRVVSPAVAAAASVERLRSGDLSVPVKARGTGELPRLLQGLDVVRQRMFDVVRDVRSGTGSVAINAGQINRDNDALAGRTTTQSESLQATAASMEQLAATVRQNAGIAERAHTLVRSAAERAEHGGRVMRGVVDTMASIRGSSHSIRDIIGVIDAIAFQTNILALNAAVEAARAGEQGRGFAVVAAEVRTLAKRCADAAQEVKALIGASVDKVDAGGSHVDEASAAMSEIVSGVREVAALIARIDTASREQSNGIDTINEAVARIDTTTQENAELVKGAARTAAALRARAVALLKAVEPFQLGARGDDDAADAIALVNAGCEFLRRHGRAAFLDEVNRLDAGQFIVRDLYLMALTTEDATFVAHGNNPARLGTGPNVKDADGKYFAREMVQLALAQGEGWVDYKWEHPVTGALSTKSGYVRREGDLVVYCAVYRN